MRFFETYPDWDFPRDMGEVRIIVRELYLTGCLWHFDDPVEECFPTASRDELDTLAAIADQIAEVCQRHGEDPFEICLDTINQYDR